MNLLEPGSALGQVWSEDFDSYATGSTISGQGGWTGWDNSGVNADVVDEQAVSAPNSLRMQTDSDMVQQFDFVTEGVWLLKTMIYIPGDHTGETWFILLNTYTAGGDPKNWSTQVVFTNGIAASAGGSGFGSSGSLPWIVDEWVELKVLIDLDANLQVITYGGKKLDESPWQIGGNPWFQAIDLYSAGGSFAYYDDLSLEFVETGARATRAISLTGNCPDPDPVAVTVSQPLGDGVDPKEVVAVTETVRGNLGAAQVKAANGGAVTDIMPTPVTDGGFIAAWLLLGPFTGHVGGNNPGCDEMRRDFLTDGQTTESNVLPEPGQTISTQFGGAAASTGILGPDYLHPGGIPTWNAHYNTNDTIDFNTEYYMSDIDNVMMYAFAYVQVKADVNVDLCVGSDDSVQVLIDGTEAWCNSVPNGRGWGYGGQCQDTVPYGFLAAGEHTVMVKVFEGGGGHGFRFGFKEAGTSNPAPGIGPCLKPGEDPCPFLPVGATITWNVPREQLAQGVGYTVDVDKGKLTFKGDVSGLNTLGKSSLIICPAGTDSQGFITGSHFIGIGPFLHTYTCGTGSESLLLGSSIANADIRTQNPSIGDTIDWDKNYATSKEYYGPLGADGKPVWREFDDGTEDGVQNLDLGLGNRDTVMGWLVTYIEYLGQDPLPINVCFGTDDGGQLWWDCDLVTDDTTGAVANTRACMALSACDVGTFHRTVTPGIHRIAAGAWDNTGGWAMSLRLLRDDGVTPIVDGDPDWAFRGGSRPSGFTPPVCEGCGPAGGSHCSSIKVTPPTGGGPGKYRVVATAKDDTGNPVILTFTATKAGAEPIVIGPRSGTLANFDLTLGTWTIQVKAGGPTNCATDSECSQEVIVCPKEGDAHCQGLQVEGPAEGGPGTYKATATAKDDAGDPLIYTFTAKRGDEAPIVVGPQPDAVASFDLGVGTWAVSVEVDDVIECPIAAADNICTTSVEVKEVVKGGRIIPGDSNGDGKIDLSDPIGTLGILFLGTGTGFPCGDGDPRHPANIQLVDWQPDGRVDLSDAIGSLTFLFLGGPAHTLAVPGAETTGCIRIVDCPDHTNCQ